ncbi:hypothetical protein [Edaphobacter aggregans]|nr:hypothetical protein [Edaphobacter aggregans]
MKFALILPFVLIAVAPLVGRWRANVWLSKNVKRTRTQQVTAELAENPAR